MFKYIVITLMFVVSTLNISCSSMGKTTATGGLIGAGVGATIGTIARAKTKGEFVRNIAIGTAAGAATGGLVGYFTHKAIEEREKNNKQKVLERINKVKSQMYELQHKDGFVPLLAAPEITEKWVPDHIDGDTFVEAHKVWIITTPAFWTTNKE